MRASTDIRAVLGQTAAFVFVCALVAGAAGAACDDPSGTVDTGTDTADGDAADTRTSGDADTTPAATDTRTDDASDARSDAREDTPDDDARPGDTVALDTRDADGPDGDAACPECPAPPVFVGSWGGYGTEPGQFVEPSSVEVHSDGVVIVAGHEDRIQRFTSDGELIDIIGEPGAGDGQFDHPHGLAVDRDGGDLIYVGDQENGRVQVFDRDGQFVRTWGDGLFQHIHDVGIDRGTGDIFVPDLELHVVRKFRATGELVASWGEQGAAPGQFDGPWGLSTDSQGFVYVADTYNRRVQKLDRDGNFIAEWTGYDGESFVKPTGVYVDDRDVVYVCDSLAERIVSFDTEGTRLEVWKLREIYGERSEPEDVVIDPTGTHIYVAEVFEHRVLHLVRNTTP